MKCKELFIIIIFSCCKLSSQNNSANLFVDSCASFTNNLIYNTGEVFVIFNIENENITLKKNPDIALDTGNIIVYPNPVFHILNFKNQGNLPIRKIMLYEMTGKTILNQELKEDQIDLSTLSAGVYFLKTDLSDTQVFKIIKK